jgi:hypothetical protein
MDIAADDGSRKAGEVVLLSAMLGMLRVQQLAGRFQGVSQPRSQSY